MRFSRLAYTLICSLLICCFVSACGSKNNTQDKLTSGIFYSPNLAHDDGTPLETYEFYDDGLGKIHGAYSEYDFAWEQSDEQIQTNRPIATSSSYIYRNGYLIDTFYKWDGSVPKGDRFDTTLSMKSTVDVSMSFKSNGEIINIVNGQERVGTYTINNEIICVRIDNTTRDMTYLVLDGKLYSNYLAPYNNG